MAKQISTLLALLMCACLWAPVQAQICYDSYFPQAMEKFEQNFFNEAIEMIDIALLCHDITPSKREAALQLRESARTGYIRVIEALRDSLQVINTQKDDSLRQALIRMQSLLSQVEHQKKACEDELALEAERLAFWAEQQIYNAEGEDALYLISRALEMDRDSISPEVRRIFGKTAFESYKQSLSEILEKVIEIQFAPAGTRFFTSLANGDIEIWDVEGKQLGRIPSPENERILDIIWAPDGENLLVSTDQRKIISYDVKGRSRFTQSFHFASITKIRYDVQGRFFLSCGRDGNVVVYQKDGSLRKLLEGKDEGPIVDAFFSPDAQTVLSRGSDGSAKLWSVEEGKVLQDLGRDHLYLYDAIFSPNGNYILTGGADKKIRLWNAEGNLVRTMEGHTGMVRQVQFSGDGSLILSRGTDQSARIWNLQGLELAVLSHNSLLFAANFSPNGNYIVTSDKAGEAKLWSNRGRLFTVMKGHEAAVTEAIFSPSGAEILTASQDGTAKLWDLNGDLLMNMDSQGGPVQEALFTPLGTQMVLASKNQPPLIVPTPNQALKLLSENPPLGISDEKKRKYGIP